MKYTRTKETYPVMDALAVAVAVDRVQGFVKSGQGYYDQEAENRIDDNRNAALVTLRVMNNKMPADQHPDAAKFKPTSDDYAKATEIFNHFDEILVMDKLADALIKQGKDGRINDYNLQMSQMFDKSEIDANKELAMIVSLPNSRRISAKRIEMSNFYRDNSMKGYIGDTKERLKISGRVKDIKYIPKYGIHLATVYTTEGKLAKFFMNDKMSETAKRIVDTDITFVGTVKKHEVNDFTGCQETMFNRVKLNEEPT
jgi:hypothetical protein